jgi:glutathione S-transferase
MPKDPADKAKARLFIHTAATHYIPQYLDFLMRAGPMDTMFKGIQMLQDMLPEDGEWLLGKDLSIADLAVAPFFPRMELAFSNDLGAYDPGEGKKAYEILSQYPGLERYRRYVKSIKEREQFQRTFDQVR